MKNQPIHRPDLGISIPRIATTPASVIGRLACLAALASTLVALAGVSPAQAETLTIGQLAPNGAASICANGGPTELILSSTAGTNPYEMPVAGTITSWVTNAGSGLGQTLKMKILRPDPLSDNGYTVIAHDGPRNLKPNAINTFPTRFPVQAGDLLGLNDANADEFPNVCFFHTATITDVLSLAEVDAPDGATITVPPLGLGARINVLATLQPRPAIGEVRPASGSFAGGTAVTILGANLEGTREVTFGGVPAPSFTVASENAVVATTPASGGLGSVDVGLSTVGGVSPPSAVARYTYTGCVVPKLKHRRLQPVRKSVQAAGCQLGKVAKAKGITAKNGKVVRQRPPAGALVVPGAEVSVKLGHLRHRR